MLFLFASGSSCSAPRLQNLLQILPAILVRSLVVLQLLLEIDDLRGSLGALPNKALVDSIDGNIDKPSSTRVSCRKKKKDMHKIGER